MADDDWRYVEAETPFAGPSNSGIWYKVPEYWRGDFTNRPTDGSSGPSIEEIRRQIMNQHPEDISVLADQWVNAWNLMHEVEQSVLQTSITLSEKDWRDGDARNAFMMAGPGKTLAYLRSWMNSALDNVAALRAQVTIVRSARSQMETLWREYEEAIKTASETDGTFGNWFWHYNLIPGGDQTDYNNANKADAIQQVNEKKKEFARRAQQLAWDTAQQVQTTFAKLNNGHGAPFYPMNALLTPIGQPNPPSLGGPPPGAPGGPPGGGPNPAPNPPPNLPPGNPNNLPTDAPNQPVGNPTAPVGGPPPLLPVANLVPQPPPVLPPPPPVLPPGPPVAPNPALAPPKGPSLLSKLTNASNLSNGLIQAKSGAPTLPEATPGALRSPGATPPPAPPLGKSIKTQPTKNVTGPGRDGTVRQPGLEEPFGRTPSSTSPPVLNNQRPGGRGRIGGRDEFNPAAPGRPGSGTPLRPTGAAPPVLNSPGQNATHTPPAPPLRPGRGSSTNPTLPGQPGQPGRPRPSGDWVGVDEARADAGAPVFDAPAPPPSGSSVSNLHEVKVRGRAADTPATAQGRARPASAVSPELTARRAHQDGTAPGIPTTGADEEGRRIITDEEAFTVNTPGGGVVTKQPEDKSYRAEPPAALGGST
jgi:hypothetical protein